jgi:hypothetical protein
MENGNDDDLTPCIAVVRFRLTHCSRTVVGDGCRTDDVLRTVRPSLFVSLFDAVLRQTLSAGLLFAEA